eukprot:14445-Heterococcus_DN1.PRE.4
MILYVSSLCSTVAKSSTLEDADVIGGSYRHGVQPLTMLRFSATGDTLAAADADCHVMLWKRTISDVSKNASKYKEHCGGSVCLINSDGVISSVNAHSFKLLP